MIPELPDTPDLGVKGTSLAALRASDSVAKRLPAMAGVASMTDEAAREAEAYAQAMKIAFDISKAQTRRSKAIAKAKGRRAQRIAERR